MNPEKLPLQSADGAQINLDMLYQIAPSCFTEARGADGKVRRVVNFDVLRQLLGDATADTGEEFYQFTWPGKAEARREAARSIRKTLRPVPEDSVDWDTTQNLYIEGDNLEVLKLLQKSYMGKVKMIYIDPPYNTGNDFVYNDDFAATAADHDRAEGNTDDLGNRYRKNTDSNGRFHSDWCSMIYPRLQLARNLLTEDGVIFISIDDNEVENMRKICNEVFGEENFRNTIIVRRRIKSLNVQFAEEGLATLNVGFEVILVYSKTNMFKMNPLRQLKANAEEAKLGKWQGFWSNADRPTMRYEVLGFTPTTGQWRRQKDYAERATKNYQDYLAVASQYDSLEAYSEATGIKEFIRRDPNGKGKNGGVYHWQAPDGTTLRTSNWLDLEVSQIQKEFDLPFENPKNKVLIMELVKLVQLSPGDIVLDFFSGSATTAHAVMQLNADDNLNRTFILVQLPEKIDKDSEAYSAGYSNIPEIAKERIRRAGRKIKEGSGLQGQSLDTGFRVFRVDESNMEDVYFQPAALSQDKLDLFLDNVKPDRTDLDLLFGAMLDWGVKLSLPMSKATVDGCDVYTVNEGDLVACFAENITENVIAHIADQSPLRVLFRDSCFNSDADKINIFEQFKQRLGWSDEEAMKNIRVI